MKKRREMIVNNTKILNGHENMRRLTKYKRIAEAKEYRMLEHFKRGAR